MKIIFNIVLAIIIYKMFFSTEKKTSFDVLKNLSCKDRETVVSLLPRNVLKQPTWAENFIGNKNYDGLTLIHHANGRREFLTNKGHVLEIFDLADGPFAKWFDRANDYYLAEGPISPEPHNMVIPGNHIITADIAHRDKPVWTDAYGEYKKLTNYGNYYIYKPHTCRHCGKPIVAEEQEKHYTHYKHNRNPITTGSVLSMQRYCGECQKKFRDSKMYYTFFINPITMSVVTHKDNKGEFIVMMRECVRARNLEEAIENRGLTSMLEAEVIEAETNNTIVDYVVNGSDAANYIRCIGLK